MDQPVTKHFLPFDPVICIIEQGFAQLPYHLTFKISIHEYIQYLLEWLSVKLEVPESESAAGLGIAYLKRCGVSEDFATQMSHRVMDEILATVCSVFPDITYQELGIARYNWDNFSTLVVQLPVRALCVQDS